ncbi:hypothetical protein YTPLAS18_28380 [Nitrospira sp.]|nr:hypothetical protein YTPLAS18_28380 [Nitrospira sp.]
MLVLAVGCAGPASQRISTTQTAEAPCCEAGRNSSWRDSVVRTATELVGARTIEVNGRRVAYDCAGVTRAIFLPVGVDLYRSKLVAGRANGVKLIYRHVRQFGRIHQGPTVRPGDLVFFHNTWDANGDGEVNDPLTHVGVVEAVEPDSTVIFISRVAGAVERYRMNLMHPHRHRAEDGRVLNDYLRRKKRRDVEGTPYLTAELFTAFGTPILR